MNGSGKYGHGTQHACAQTSKERKYIRILFLVFLLSVPVFMLVRMRYGEPYPGPFMPGFSGAGIKMLSPDIAVAFVQEIVVKFNDDSTANVSTTELYGRDASSAHGALLTMTTGGDTGNLKGFSGKYRKRLRTAAADNSGDGARPSPTTPSDVKAYLRTRLTKLFPTKQPITLTVLNYKNTVRLTDLQLTTREVSNAYTISLNEDH